MVFRLGFAPTRPAARQLVNHGHVLINNKVVSIPSYNVQTKDLITLSKTAIEIPVIKDVLENKKPTLPEWLEIKNNTGKMVREPTLTDVKEPISVIDIVEFYSR